MSPLNPTANEVVSICVAIALCAVFSIPVLTCFLVSARTKIRELRNGQHRWAEIATHHAKKSKEWCVMYQQEKQVNGALIAETTLCAEMFNAIAIEIWGEPQLKDRNLADVLDFIRLVRKTNDELLEARIKAVGTNTGLASIVKEMDERLKAIRVERDAAREERDRLMAMDHEAASLVNIMLQYEYAIAQRPAGDGMQYEVYGRLTTCEPLAVALTPHEAVALAVAKEA